ncbi:reduced male fertility, Probable F-box protein [Zostera marina]|uniref:Reduced male fertility, Probable F-box protein n=1 Tax=Zostera marina TaxID=29655 RepID=A0A0K9NUY5_ZOSMR|nr:reduced male fertility, Probable F-box protein [Zostera marina]
MEGGREMQRSTKRRRSAIAACTSPRSATFLTAHSSSSMVFTWYEEDAWTEVAKFLDGRYIARLGVVNKWFHRVMTQDLIWKYATLRDLQIPEQQGEAYCKWKKLYTSAFDGSHSYSFRQQEKHIDWMRIGAFYFQSSTALLSEHLEIPKRIPKCDENLENTIEHSGICLLTNVKIGIWLADLQLVRCPVCNLNTCEGTMQTLDARHSELFLHDEFKSGKWDFEDIGVHRVDSHCNAAAGALFEVEHLKSTSTASVMDTKSWIGQTNDWQPKARIGHHAVAVNTNLQPNEGINVKFQVMRDGIGGEIIGIRISQQLL